MILIDMVFFTGK